MVLEERDLLSPSDLELQYSGAGSGVAFPPPLVTTGISGGRDAHERRYERSRHEHVGSQDPSQTAGEAAPEVSDKATIGVTTTVEQYYR